MDRSRARKFDLLCSSTAGNALSIAQEREALRDSYGRTKYGQSLLLARRLVEAGTTGAAVTASSWPGVASKAATSEGAVTAPAPNRHTIPQHRPTFSQRSTRHSVLTIALRCATPSSVPSA
jgi:hypothetical protein